MTPHETLKKMSGGMNDAEIGTRAVLGLLKFTPIVVLLWFVFQLQADVRKLVEAQKDNYTITQAAEYALRQAIANPGAAIPDPRDPSRIIRVSVEDDVGAIE